MNKIELTAANDNNANDNTARPAAFDAAVMAYLPGLKKLAARMVPREYRDDLVTDTIMYVLERWRNFRGDYTSARGGLWNWLQWNMRGVVSNQAVTAKSRKRRASFVPMDGHVYHLATPATQHASAEAREAIDRIDGRDGDVLLRRAMGFGLEEIGADIGVTRERVRQLEVKARARLKKRMAA